MPTLPQPLHLRTLLIAVVAGLLAAVALALVPSGPASAIPCDPTRQDCGPGGGGDPYPYHFDSTLTVTAPSVGTVTSDPAGISCPATCVKKDTLFNDVNVRPTTGWTTYTLTATGGRTGFIPSWTGCDSVTSDHKCVVTNDAASTTVSLAWHDAQPPTVSLAAPTEGKVGRIVHVSAVATDNDAVSTVQFLVDGTVKATDSSAPYDGTISMDGYPDGSQHMIGARAVDDSGNISATVTRTVTVDKSVSLTVGQVPAYISSPAQSVVDIATDTDASMQCRSMLTGTLPAPSAQACAAPSHQFLGDGDADGMYTFQITATDDVGNVTTVTRSTVLDTVRPAIAITTAPKSGVVASAGTFTAHATDANLDDVTCTLDGRAIACVNDLATHATFKPGRHTFVATARDLAGNTASASRAFTSRAKVTLRATKKVHGHRVTLRAKHIPTAATGKVVFSKGRHKLCKASVHHGVATCRTHKLHKGKYKVTVRYLGSAYYLPAHTTLRFRVK